METVANIEPILQTGCAQPYVAIAVVLNLNEWDMHDIVVKELTDWLSHNGVKIAGPLFYRYLTLGNLSTPFNIEVGYPVATEVQGNGRIITGSIPKGTFATLVHCGHPGNLNTSLEIMQCWARKQDIQWKYDQQNGKQVWAGCFEFYLTNPTNIPDKSQWRMALALLIEEKTSA